MEKKIFPVPAVAEALNKYIEARLHTDGTANIERILALQKQLSGTVANPVYVLVDPVSEAVLRKFEGATRDAQEFARFLERGP